MKQSKKIYLLFALVAIIMDGVLFGVLWKRNLRNDTRDSSVKTRNNVSDIDKKEKKIMESKSSPTPSPIMENSTRELTTDEINKISKCKDEAFQGLSEKKVKKIREKIRNMHFLLEDIIVYDKLGNETNPKSEKWNSFNDFQPDDNVDSGHSGEDMVKDLEWIHENIQSDELKDIIETAKKKMSAILHNHSNIELLEVHEILHDVDYWMLSYPCQGFKIAPADWSGINIYYCTFDKLLLED